MLGQSEGSGAHRRSQVPLPEALDTVPRPGGPGQGSPGVTSSRQQIWGQMGLSWGSP